MLFVLRQEEAFLSELKRSSKWVEIGSLGSSLLIKCLKLETCCILLKVKQYTGASNNYEYRTAIHGKTQRDGWGHIYQTGVIGESIESKTKGSVPIIGVKGIATLTTNNSYENMGWYGSLVGLDSQVTHNYTQGTHSLDKAYGVRINDFETQEGSKTQYWYGLYIFTTLSWPCACNNVCTIISIS